MTALENSRDIIRRAVRHDFTILLVRLLTGIILSVIDRTDTNWDLQHYHLYTPCAALNGRIGRDYFVAGFQG
jgi:hypothetical protein